MDGDAPGVPPLPDHPELREVALAMEGAGASGDILDARWRTVFISSELARLAGVAPGDVGRYYGESIIVRHLDHPMTWGTDEETAVAWWRQNIPIMRRYLQPGDPDFEAVFARNAEAAARARPLEAAPRAWQETVTFPPEHVLRASVFSDLTFLELRLNADDGAFLGVARLVRTALPEGLLTRLARGDRRLFERMDRVSEPGKRPAGILFVDLEASGALSRRLPSRGYFELIRVLTDLIDSSVVTHGGIVGKHAGDGGSALFLAADFGGSESRAARATIEAARAIRDGVDTLGPDAGSVMLNTGLHWGATLMVGQVATRGRLEVTALGDQMNEGARIEAAAQGGAILASKDIIERLDAPDAKAIGIDPDAIAYTPLGELDGAGEKAIRDAGAIPVAHI
jgi:class 3 adenylate cyclase